MKPILTFSLGAGAVMLLAGCASDGLSAREVTGSTYPKYVSNLPAVPTNGVPARLNYPLRLGVAQVGEPAPPQTLLKQIAADRAHFVQVMPLALAGEPAAPNYYVANSRSVKGDADYAREMQTLCQQAKAAGLDHVLILGGTLDSWEKQSFLSIADCTLIGAWIVPATEIKMEGKVAGVMVDTATGQPQFYISAESQQSCHAADALVSGNKDELRVITRNDLANKLAAALLAQAAGN